MSEAKLLILIAALLPPQSLNLLGAFVEERMVQTPYGDVGPLALRCLEDASTEESVPDANVWVQPYAGLPTRTDPRATLYAAQKLGIEYVLNWDMGIAINPVLQPGQPLIVTDYIDWTRHQPTTFTQESTAAEINMRSANYSRTPTAAQTPFCTRINTSLQSLLPYAPNGIYLGIDGPRRATAAEVRMYRQWGADVVGYNLVPEVALAQELGLRYAGLVTIGSRNNQLTNELEEEAIRRSLGATLNVLPGLIRMLQC